jgi:hypothetical protein
MGFGGNRVCSAAEVDAEPAPLVEADPTKLAAKDIKIQLLQGKEPGNGY